MLVWLEGLLGTTGIREGQTGPNRMNTGSSLSDREVQNSAGKWLLRRHMLSTSEDQKDGGGAEVTTCRCHGAYV